LLDPGVEQTNWRLGGGVGHSAGPRSELHLWLKKAARPGCWSGAEMPSSPPARNGPQRIHRPRQRTSLVSITSPAGAARRGDEPLRTSDPDATQRRRGDRLDGPVHEDRLVAW